MLMRLSILLVLMGFISFSLGAAQDDSCIQPRLIAGLWAEVLEDPANSLRALPDADAAIIGSIPTGRLFSVLDGMECQDGVLWRHVRYDGQEGWTAEATGSQHLLKPAFSNGDVISPNNVRALQEIANFGRGQIGDAILSPDGRWLALAIGDVGIWMYDLNHPELEAWLLPGRLIAKPKFSADSAYIAGRVCEDWSDAGGGHVGCAEEAILMWDVVTAHVVLSIPVSQASLEFSPVHPLLFVSARDGIHVWDIPTRAEVLVLHDVETEMGYSDYRVMSFSANGELLLTLCSCDGIIRVWGITSGQRLYTMEMDMEYGQTVEINYDGSHIIVPAAASNQTSRLIELATQSTIFELAWNIRPASDHFFLPDGRTIGLKYPDGRAFLYDYQTNAAMQAIGSYDTYSFSRDMSKFAGLYRENRLDIVDTATLETLTSYNGLYRITDLVFSNDSLYGIGRTRAIESPDYPERIVNLANNEIIDTLTVYDYGLSATGQVLTGSWMYQEEYEFEGFRENILAPLQPFTIPEGYGLWTYVFVDNQLRLILGNESSLNVWDVASSQFISTMPRPERSVTSEPYNPFKAISPDGRFMIFSDEEETEFQIWNLETGEIVQRMPRTINPMYTIFSPDSTTVVLIDCESSVEYAFELNGMCISPQFDEENNNTGESYQYQIYFWDFVENRVSHAEIETSDIGSMSFSPDGGLFAVAGCGAMYESSYFCREGKFEIYDATNGESLLSQAWGEDSIYQLRFSPDGKAIALAGHNRGSLWAVPR